ncbi:MAG: class I SAM-dependent methyltransferase [Bacteroidota bacterium]
MTDQIQNSREPFLAEASQFYDTLAEDYDTMTGFDKRFIHEKPFFNLLMQRFGITTALDAGAGTGFHSLLLGQLGARMTAVEVSKKMVVRLKAHAKERRLNIDVIESSFQNLPKGLNKKFDAVLCMGNSLPHLLTYGELVQSLKNFSAVLHPGGVLLLQLLNYDRILANKERVQSVKEAGGVTFIRFYEFHEGHVIFNILRLKKEDGRLIHSIDSIKLRPIVKVELTNALQESGFDDLRFHGSIALDDFHVQTSKDLVVLALQRKATN